MVKLVTQPKNRGEWVFLGYTLVNLFALAPLEILPLSCLARPTSHWLFPDRPPNCAPNQLLSTSLGVWISFWGTDILENLRLWSMDNYRLFKQPVQPDRNSQTLRVFNLPAQTMQLWFHMAIFPPCNRLKMCKVVNIFVHVAELFGTFAIKRATSFFLVHVTFSWCISDIFGYF